MTDVEKRERSADDIVSDMARERQGLQDEFDALGREVQRTIDETAERATQFARKALVVVPAAAAGVSVVAAAAALVRRRLRRR